VWDEQKEQEMYQFGDDNLDSIKRVMSTDYYILKTELSGLKLFTINDLE
jgi:hypothetical protein